jgi:hypothetical protein
MLFCGTKGPRTPNNRLLRTENLIVNVREL